MQHQVFSCSRSAQASWEALGESGARMGPKLLTPARLPLTMLTPQSEVDFPSPEGVTSRFVLLCSLRSQPGKASVPRNQVSRWVNPKLVKHA
jgi:hypothetical protein